MDLTGRTALVTGGNRGIGAGCAIALAEAGADVAISYRRDEDSAKETAARIEALGRKVFVDRADISIEDQARSVCENALNEFGKIDIVVANAGVASRGKTVRDTSTEEFHKLMNTHVFGALWVCQGCIDSMREQGRGNIVLISSVATKQHSANGAPYTMAKVSMEALGKALALEEGPHGIRTNIVAPGLVETEMGRRLSMARGASDIKDLYATHPFGRVCQPEDIANVAVFLCSEKGEYVNGQVIYVDGGGFIRKP